MNPGLRGLRAQFEGVEVAVSRGASRAPSLTICFLYSHFTKADTRRSRTGHRVEKESTRESTPRLMTGGPGIAIPVK